MSNSLESLKKDIEETGKLKSKMPDEFYKELIEYGIESVQQFNEAYEGQYKDGPTFAKKICEKAGYLEEDETGVPSYITDRIDWQRVWTEELRFDYSEVNGHFFSIQFE